MTLFKNIFAITTLLGLLIIHPCHAVAFKNLIVFGDSLSDKGNNSWVNATGAPITSFDEQGNKYTWADYLSIKLFKQIAHSSSESNLDPLKDNVIYAFASADSSGAYLDADWPHGVTSPLVNTNCEKPGLNKDKNGTVISACVPGVDRQVSLYLDAVKQKPNPESLFFIWVGANDLFYKLSRGEPASEIIKGTVFDIYRAKNLLVWNGVSPQHIYVMNLPNLSLTPFAKKHDLNLTDLTAAFNAALAATLTTNEDPQFPGIPASHIISIFDLLNDTVRSPEKYNLSNTTDSCIEKGEAPLCKGYLFYDMKHPTAMVHNRIAEIISKQVS